MIDAIYFDGRSTRRHPVTLMMHRGVLAIEGEGIRRSARVSGVHISEAMQHGPRILRFPDGGFLEIAHPLLDRMLKQNGYRDPWIVRWQQHWGWVLFALVTVLAVLGAGYRWGLPWAADRVAQHLPSSFERKIGDHGLELLDKVYLTPSQLTVREQQRLRTRFSQLVQPNGDHTAYRLEFRNAEKIGPNAFALPNGVIVMTDQLAKIANNDNALLAVLGHELGHLKRRHFLRRLLQTAGVGVTISLLIGDVSSGLATVQTFVLDQKYSRDFEREADQYAIEMMQTNGIPLSPMATLFEQIRTVHDKKSGRVKQHDYLNSHPSDDERIARLRAVDTKR